MPLSDREGSAEERVHRLHIIVDPSTLDCLNLGDVAMLKVAVTRLHELWPDSDISVFTNDKNALARHCPGVQPVEHAGRTLWFSQRGLLGSLWDYIPQGCQRPISLLTQEFRRRWPGGAAALFRLKTRLRRTGDVGLELFLATVKRADLYVVSGAATLNDKAKNHALIVLETLEMAVDRDIPAVLFSQGIGPLSDPELIARVRSVLPRAQLIAVREGVTAPRVLAHLGVASDRVMVTGDDATQLAYELRKATPGVTIGVNLRVGPSSDADKSSIDIVGPIVREFAKRWSAPLLPVPIALPGGSDDPKTIARLLADQDNCSDGGRILDCPEKIIRQVGRCRVVVTGAYHAAVFALVQGVPAVCIAFNRAYREKFLGLADQFGPGCQVLFLDSPDSRHQIGAAIQAAWESADKLRPLLIESAARQVESSQFAYKRAKELPHLSIRKIA